MTPRASSDDDLMRRLRDSVGSAREDAFRELIGRHGPALRAHVAPIAGSRADDVVQETFLRIYQHRTRYQPQAASFRSWAHRVARNLALNSRRKESRVRGLGQEVFAPREAPGAGLEARERSAALEAALARLRPADQEVVRLRYFQGLSYAEVAEVTGHSPAATKQRAWRALKQLRSLLEESP